MATIQRYGRTFEVQRTWGPAYDAYTATCGESSGDGRTPDLAIDNLVDFERCMAAMNFGLGANDAVVTLGTFEHEGEIFYVGPCDRGCDCGKIRAETDDSCEFAAVGWGRTVGEAIRDCIRNRADARQVAHEVELAYAQRAAQGDA